jgi:membrane-associated protease RseP (regulator of RpoE activity)
VGRLELLEKSTIEAFCAFLSLPERSGGPLTLEKRRDIDTMRMTLLSLSLMLAPIPSLLAVPDPAEAPKKEVAVEEEEKGPGFLGVSAGELSAALAAQLKLDHGVKLNSVSPDSPAGKAGLEVDDIITEVGEKKISTMLELRDAIRAHKQGDEVTLKLVQKGNVVVKKVTLAEAPVLPQLILPQEGFQFRGFQGGQLQLNIGGRGGRFKMGDQDGSVEMKGNGEGREVTVWDLSNKVVYEGPWVTPQDKAAPTPKMRQRIERVANMFAGRGNLLQERRLAFPLAPPPAPARRPARPDDDLPKPKEEDGEREEGEPE